jgi:hypothetical protein
MEHLSAFFLAESRFWADTFGMETVELSVAAPRLACPADELHQQAVLLRALALNGRPDLVGMAALMVDIAEQMSRMQLLGTSEWSTRDAGSR